MIFEQAPQQRARNELELEAPVADQNRRRRRVRTRGSLFTRLTAGRSVKSRIAIGELDAGRLKRPLSRVHHLAPSIRLPALADARCARG